MVVLVVVPLRGGRGHGLEGDDQRRDEAGGGHALKEGAARVIGLGAVRGLVAHLLHLPALLLSNPCWTDSDLSRVMCAVQQDSDMS